jgi:hypothetical protein
MCNRPAEAKAGECKDLIDDEVAGYQAAMKIPEAWDYPPVVGIVGVGQGVPGSGVDEDTLHRS